MPFKFETARSQAASIQDLTAADRFRVPDKSRFSSQPLRQSLGLIRSWHVNARSMAESSEMEVTNPEGLDTIFRAHYERIVASLAGSFMTRPAQRT
jgi:hypothetical protein